MSENTYSAATEGVSEVAQQIRENVLATVKQGQQITLEAAEAWSKVVSGLPTPPAPSYAPAPKDVEAVTAYAFDFAGELLAAQREFALRLTSTLLAARAA